MPQHIVVLGAGYSGLPAAKLTAQSTRARVTLVNASDRFVERIRLHQLAAGQRLKDLPLTSLLRGSGVDLVVDRVTAIDADQKQIMLERSERPLTYDTLVYALGSRTDHAGVPGAAEYAYSVNTREEAERLRERILSGPASDVTVRAARTPAAVGAGAADALEPTVEGRLDDRPGRRTREREAAVVVGGGLTGLETVTELAESFPHLHVHLVTAGPLGERLSAKGQAHLWRVCSRLGIEVRENARVTEVLPDGVRLEDGGWIESGIVIWATGFQAPSLAREAGFAVNERGRLLVDRTLASVSHPDVYGVGDAAAATRADGQELRMACGVGLPLGKHLASVLAAREAGRRPRPTRYDYLLQCISLGRRDGLIQLVNADDSPKEKVVTGRTAARIKEMIVRGAAYTQRRSWVAKLAPTG